MAKKAYVGIKALPDGYTEVEYIEGTGTQYIDSGFIPNGKTRIIMDVEIVSHLDHGAYFGTRAAVSGTDSVSNTLFIMSEGTLRSDYYGNTGSSTGIPEGRHILDRNMNVTTAGDYTITQTASTTASTYPLAIFGVNTAGEVSKCACIKLYSCSIYDNGVLVRKFIPCLNGDSVAGMYDCVGNAFYGNGGSREFLFGSHTNNTVISKVLKNIYVGAEKEFPVYDVTVPQTVITTSNITNYFTVSNGSYYFSGSGDKFTSNNKGAHGTTAITTLTAKQDYTLLSFTYSYSGEEGCDYLNLRVNGVAIETNAYGSTTTKTYTGSILAGQTIEFSFRKDGSVDRYDDCATWSNMVVEHKTQSGTENRVVARRISKIYIGDESGLAKLIFGDSIYNIGIAGKLGFGVGVYDGTDEELSSIGLSILPGTKDINSADYGTYKHTNGSYVSYVPVFVYRIGYPSAPSYLRDGADAIEISGNISLAGKNGWVLHRAFIDGGKIKKGFFVDKYNCNSSNVSLKGSSVYFPSEAYSSTWSRARGRGTNWGIVSAFMWSAINMLSLAHGQASSSNENCAWWDSANNTSWPRGYGWDTTGVSFSSRTSGGCVPMNMSTHNGQDNGICDISGMGHFILSCVSLQSGYIYVYPENLKFVDYDYSKNINTSITCSSRNVSWNSSGVLHFKKDAYDGFERALCGVYPAATSGGTSNGTLFGSGSCMLDTSSACQWIRTYAQSMWSRYYSWVGGADGSVCYRCAAYI